MPEPRSLEEWENYCHSTLPASHRWSASEGLCLSCTRAYAKQEKTYFIGWLEAWCKSLLGIPSHIKPGYPPVGMDSLITAVGHQRDALLAVARTEQRIKWEADWDDRPWHISHRVGQELQDALSHPIVQRLVKEE